MPTCSHHADFMTLMTGKWNIPVHHLFLVLTADVFLWLWWCLPCALPGILGWSLVQTFCI